MKWPFALLVVAGLGCMPPAEAAIRPRTRVVHVHVDSSFTDDERMRLYLAIIKWNQTLNGQVRFEVEREEPSVLVIKKVPSSLPGPTPDAIAWADFIGGNEISVKDDIAKELVEPVMLHEIGHILGAEHVEGTLMNPAVYPNYLCVDETTGRHVAQHLRLDPQSLQTCAGFQ